MSNNKEQKQYFASVVSFNLETVTKSTQAKIKKIPAMIEIAKPNGGSVVYYVDTQAKALLLLAGVVPTMEQDGTDGDGKTYLSPVLLSGERSLTVTAKGLERIAKGGSDKSKDRFEALKKSLLNSKALETAFTARWRAIGNEVAKDKATTAKRGRGRYTAPQGHGMAWFAKTDLTYNG